MFSRLLGMNAMRKEMIMKHKRSIGKYSQMPFLTASPSSLMTSDTRMAASIHANSTSSLEAMEKKFWLESEKRFVTLKVSAAGMRNINKNGLEAELKKAMENGYIDIV